MARYHFIRIKDEPLTWGVCNLHSITWKMPTYFYEAEANDLIEHFTKIDLPAYIHHADSSGVPYTKLEYAHMIFLHFDNVEDESAFMLLASDGLEL
jgi:hypothetical protein